MSFRQNSRVKRFKSKFKTMRRPRFRRPKKKNSIIIIAVLGVLGFVAFKFKDKIKEMFAKATPPKIGG